MRQENEGYLLASQVYVVENQLEILELMNAFVSR